MLLHFQMIVTFSVAVGAAAAAAAVGGVGQGHRDSLRLGDLARTPHNISIWVRAPLVSPSTQQQAQRSGHFQEGLFISSRPQQTKFLGPGHNGTPPRPSQEESRVTID